MRILDVQQGTDAWHSARNGVITGTRLKQVLGRASKSLLYELIAESLVSKNDLDATEAMERGSELESDAIMLYEAISGYGVDAVGFVLHSDHDWIGVSPDGLIKQKGKYVGAVEVKCPDTKTHIKYLDEGKIPSEYKAQVLMYFIVCDSIEWLDFVSYDPRIQLPEMQVSITRVTREELAEDIEVAMAKLTKFRISWEKILDKYLF